MNILEPRNGSFLQCKQGGICSGIIWQQCLSDRVSNVYVLFLQNGISFEKQIMSNDTAKVLYLRVTKQSLSCHLKQLHRLL